MFVKIFPQILESSLAEDWQVRLVFEDLLKLADPTGTVDITHEAFARRTNVPINIVTHGISELEKPDPKSRTPDCEGRRIIRIDAHRNWGWKIVNYIKYRESASKEMLRMGEAERKREYRRRKGLPSYSPSKEEPKSTEEDMSHSCPGQSGTKPKKAQEDKALVSMKIPSLSEIKLFCAKSGIPNSDAEWFFYKCDANGWTNGGKPIKKWNSTILSWKAAGYLPSLKNGSSKPEPSSTPTPHPNTIAYRKANPIS